MAESYRYGGRETGRGRVRGQFDTDRCKEDQDKPVFPVKRALLYSGSTPLVDIPKAIGSFSIDGDRKFLNDRSMLRFIHTKYIPEDEMKVQMNLNKSLDKLIKFRGYEQETFEILLQWVLSHQDQLTSKDTLQRLSVDFVCSRGSMRKIMMTPYSITKSWTILVTKFKGTFYMTHRNAVKENDDGVVSPHRLWGHKFEQYMKGDPNKSYDANEEFRCVLKLSLGDDTFLYAPEVDGADPESFEEDYQDLGAFVTVKCSRQLVPRSIENYKRFKLSEWYVDNKLAGIPLTIVGFRSDSGIVHTLELLHTEDLPQKGGNKWDPSVFFNFFLAFLSFLKKKVKDPLATYKFEFEPEIGITCTKLTGEKHINILPSWYTEELFSSDDREED